MNSDKTSRWKVDVASSVDFYNAWFLDAAPTAFREKRIEAIAQVRVAFELTNGLRDIRPETLRDHPEILQMLRLTAAPPLARDRLIGLAGVRTSLVEAMEKELRTQTKDRTLVHAELSRISKLIGRLVDPDLFPWLKTTGPPNDSDAVRAATIVADRLCGVLANPIIRNAQEQRQLSLIRGWLEAIDYRYIASGAGLTIKSMPPGTFAFRLSVPVTHARRSTSDADVTPDDLGSALLGIPAEATVVETTLPTTGKKRLNIPIDVAIMPKRASPGSLPVMIEAKSEPPRVAWRLQTLRGWSHGKGNAVPARAA